MRLIALLLLSSGYIVQAGDARLEAIHALLMPMRGREPWDTKARGATPALSTVKHVLREWIESRLPALKWGGLRWSPDPVVLQEQLNDELSQAGLFCDSRSKIPCPPQNQLGSVGRIILDMKRESFLVVRTSLGIQCGYDESAYMYYRAWQTKGASAEPVLLLAGKDFAFISDALRGSVTRTDVLFEYTVFGAQENRPEIRHYALKDEHLERVDPVALSPRNFAAFWLTQPWPENSRWTAKNARTKLEAWQRENKGLPWDFGFPARRCQQQPDLWQLSGQTDDGSGAPGVLSDPLAPAVSLHDGVRRESSAAGLHRRI